MFTSFSSWQHLPVLVLSFLIFSNKFCCLSHLALRPLVVLVEELPIASQDIHCLVTELGQIHPLSNLYLDKALALHYLEMK